MKKSLLIYSTALFLGTNFASANIILNMGGILHWSDKTIEARDVKGNVKSTLRENFLYPGGSTGLEFPFLPNSIAISSNLNILYSKYTIQLNQYNIKNYEYYYVQSDGTRRNTINTCSVGGAIQNCVTGKTGQTYGTLADFNLQEKIQKTMETTGKNYDVEATDLIILSNIMMKYNTPVYFPWKGKGFEVTSKVLKTINPYFGVGISTVMVNRKLTLNREIKSGLDSENGFSILPPCSGDPDLCERIEGEDPAPDPDFFLTVGGGFNFAFPFAKLFGIQNVLTVELLYHIGLTPDDTNKTFDDNYNFRQRGFSIRIASGILL